MTYIHYIFYYYYYYVILYRAVRVIFDDVEHESLFTKIIVFEYVSQTIFLIVFFFTKVVQINKNYATIYYMIRLK